MIHFAHKDLLQNISSLSVSAGELAVATQVCIRVRRALTNGLQKSSDEDTEAPDDESAKAHTVTVDVDGAIYRHCRVMRRRSILL